MAPCFRERAERAGEKSHRRVAGGPCATDTHIYLLRRIAKNTKFAKIAKNPKSCKRNQGSRIP
jgi:hypothetical protein